MARWENLKGTTETSLSIGKAKATIDAGGLSASRTYTLPNVAGTFALLERAQSFTVAQVMLENLAVGAQPNSTSTSLTIGDPTAGYVGTSCQGANSRGNINNAVTSSYDFYRSAGTSTNVSFTTSDVRGFYARDLSKGASHTVTRQVGFETDDLVAGTTNYAFKTAITSGANKYSLYSSGSAKSFHAGNLLLGTNTDSGELLRVDGASLFINTATFTVSPVFTDQAGTRTALGLETSISVAQTTHGFSVGHTIQMTGSGWATADRDAAATACDAIVSVVVDANNFVATLVGKVTLTTGQWDSRTGDSGGLTQGEYYWLSSTAGGLTKTQPTSGIVQYIGVALSTTVMAVNIGEAIEATAADPEVAALAGVTTAAADQVPYFTSPTAMTTTTLTAGGRALINSAGTANTIPYFSASNTVTLTSITANAVSLLGDTDVPRLTVAGTWTANQTYSGLKARNNIVNTTTQTAVDQTHGGLLLRAVTMNTTNKYTPGYFFGSSDADLTTTNPKIFSGIVGYATENLTSDSAGGGALEFFATRKLPGTNPSPDSVGTWDYENGLNPTKIISGMVGTKAAVPANTTVTVPAGYSMVLGLPLDTTASGAVFETEAGAVLVTI